MSLILSSKIKDVKNKQSNEPKAAECYLNTKPRQGIHLKLLLNKPNDCRKTMAFKVSCCCYKRLWYPYDRYFTEH